MDVEYLLGSVLRGVLTSRGKRKRTKGAMRYVLGNPQGVMLLGGLAFALYESLTKGSGIGTSPAPAPPTPPVPHAAGSAGAVVVPPPPPVAGGTVMPPPLPVAAAAPLAASPETASADTVPAEVLRVIRLSISAARADGQLTTVEQDAILEQARQVGAQAIIEPDLRAPRPVAEILGGVTNDFQRHQLYSIAFAIVRADEQVTPQERLYLQQVATALALDAATVARLEQQAAARIAEPADDADPS